MYYVRYLWIILQSTRFLQCEGVYNMSNHQRNIILLILEDEGERLVDNNSLCVLRGRTEEDQFYSCGSRSLSAVLGDLQDGLVHDATDSEGAVICDLAQLCSPTEYL